MTFTTHDDLDDWEYTTEPVRLEDVRELERIMALPFPGEPEFEFRVTDS